MGKHNRWIDNLAGHVLWPGTFNGRNEYTSEEYEGAFEGTKAIDPIIQVCTNSVIGKMYCVVLVPGVCLCSIMHVRTQLESPWPTFRNRI